MQYTFRDNSFLERRIDADDSADPMGSLANLADVMLVFACGLMMALVVFWNLDLPNIEELSESDMQQVEDVEEIVGEITSTTNPYMELGKVYQDPATGKLYMLTEAEDGDAAGNQAAGAEAAASEDGSQEGANEGSAAEAGTSN